ncbi:MAG TPA: class I SAM-dependent methyltransferase [Thermoanaerobaculia bacterium]|nr:class I SAM-dependent methyltransferase [Thermoanaerobaculia bacterium]
MTFLSRKTGQFSYFAQQVGNGSWQGKSVLDFGGNVGNILRDARATIERPRYWCIDVVRESIDAGRARYPSSHWIHYDRYCFFFNPHGVPGLPLPSFDHEFDYIVAYSVFTNTSRADMLDLVAQLEARLADGGTLAFTYIDPHHVPWPGKHDVDNFQWRLAREHPDASSPEAHDMLRKAREAEWCMLVNGQDLYVEQEEMRAYHPDEQKTCHVFYSTQYMKELFPHASIRGPVNGEMQHCCVIRK